MYLHKSLLACLRRFIQDSRGAFAISFVIMSGFLLGLAAFGLEGSRYISERARLSDAMEQAALALTAEDNGPGAKRNETLASDYFRAWMRHDVKVFKPVIVVKNGVSQSNGNLSYVEYRVSGQTLQNSWFSSSFFPSFDKTVTIGENGAARKFRSNMDVMFVVDFSSSMQHPLETMETGISKIDELKRIVLKIAEELFYYDIDNKVGFVPFAWGAKEGDYCDFPFVANTPEVPQDVLKNYTYEVNAFTSYIDFPATIAAIPNFVPRVGNFNIPLSKTHFVFCMNKAIAWKIPLSSDIEKIREIEQMHAEGNTLVSSGVLLGTSYLAQGTASRKALIIISDGEDKPEQATITPRLLAAGMCEKIKSVLNTNDSVTKIAFIGVGYKPTIDWKSCVGEKNFFLPETVDELERDLHRAVYEEVGHNTLKDL